MKIKTLIKITCSIAHFWVATTASAQDPISIIEPLPNNSEKLDLIYPKAYWFNSYKVKIVNFGVAKIKESPQYTNGLKTQKISINLTDSNRNTSTLNTRTVQVYEYVTKTHYLENDLLRLFGTGLEVDTEELLIDSIGPKTITGTIATNFENTQNWNIDLLIVKRLLLCTEIGKITNGKRTISVIPICLESNNNINSDSTINEGSYFYEFLENGISLGAVTGGFNPIRAIWLKPDLDPSTKLILCTSMLLLREN